MIKREPESITGRDTSIVCKALAYAITVIERRPIAFREHSDCQDMKKLLAYYAPATALGVEHFMDGARRHIDGIGIEYDGKNVINMMDALKAEVDKKE